MPKRKRTLNKTESKEISEAFKKLGRNLEMNIKAAWQSPQREKLEEEIAEGLSKLIKGIDKLIFRAKEKNFKEKAKSGLLKAVQKANAKLEEVYEKWEMEDKDKKK